MARLVKEITPRSMIPIVIMKRATGLSRDPLMRSIFRFQRSAFGFALPAFAGFLFYRLTAHGGLFPRFFHHAHLRLMAQSLLARYDDVLSALQSLGDFGKAVLRPPRRHRDFLRFAFRDRIDRFLPLPLFFDHR